MKLVIDLDGTICPIRKPEENYADLIPLSGAKERLAEFKKEGHYIIIQTARNMATQQSNLGKVVKNIGKITLDWLDKYEIVYDEIYFGKPNADLYIDDRSLRFNTWEETDLTLIKNLAKVK